MGVGADGAPHQLSGADIRCRVANMTQSRIAENLNGFLSHFAADATVHYNSAKDGLFTRGTLEGRDAFRANLRQIQEVYRGVDCEILNILVEGDSAWVRWRSHWRHIGKNRIVTVYMANFLRWRNDKVIEMHEFLDAVTPATATYGASATFDAILQPPPPGLERGEIVARAHRIAAAHAAPEANSDVFRQYFSPDVVCDFVGDPSRLYYAGKRVGLAAMFDLICAAAVDFEQLRFSLSDIAVEGGWFACRRTVEWRHRGTGKQRCVEFADFLKFENGQIVEVVEFRDTATMVRMQSDQDYAERRVIY